MEDLNLRKNVTISITKEEAELLARVEDCMNVTRREIFVRGMNELLKDKQK